MIPSAWDLFKLGDHDDGPRYLGSPKLWAPPRGSRMTGKSEAGCKDAGPGVRLHRSCRAWFADTDIPFCLKWLLWLCRQLLLTHTCRSPREILS